VPAVYFWIVDRIAIGMGTWYLSSELTTGVAVLGLPIEEMLFFTSANLMTVNGLVLFEWVLDWNDRRTAPSSVGTASAGAADRSGPNESAAAGVDRDPDSDEFDPTDD
jgi:hypothetical protein